MDPDRPRNEPDDDRPAPVGDGATGGRRIEEAIPPPADPGPEHDPTTSREAYEREMAERGLSEEAQREGDHIE